MFSHAFAFGKLTTFLITKKANFDLLTNSECNIVVYKRGRQNQVDFFLSSQAGKIYVRVIILPGIENWTHRNKQLTVPLNFSIVKIIISDIVLKITTEFCKWLITRQTKNEF